MRFSKEAAFELDGNVKEYKKRQNTKYDINHLSKAQFKSAEICQDFISMPPNGTFST